MSPGQRPTTELGGDSVMAAQLAARLRARFPGVAIRPRNVFTAPTVAGLAELVARHAGHAGLAHPATQDEPA